MDQAEGRSDLTYLNTTATSVTEPSTYRAESEQKTPTTVTTIKTNHAETISHFKSDIDNNLVNIDEMHSVETACIRPQLFYNPNRNPDSVAYEMVVSCPPGFPDSSILAKCKAGLGNENIADIIPITSKLTGLTYINTNCLFCNEPLQLFTPSCDEWQLQLYHRILYYKHRSIIHPQSIMSWPPFQYFNVHFLPKNSSSAQKCILYDVSSCNQTGLWGHVNKTIELVCHQEDHLPMTHTVKEKRLLFKNISCVHCNTPYWFIESPLLCAYAPDIQPNRQTLNINFHSSALLSTQGLEDISVNYIDT